ncbi:hypothetical protein KUV85_00320 [Nocardioides panacisoli]|uniref:thioredoxin family protein n=1 Tax=Nocardioides panacisoli TaxID=627624 RepID=UPI001C62DF38|nr:thioredoxin domain-containing protein [Nocardioides panacisoli]QYJ04159.1 hypothetical protein KUV85_00320 [Nocardioides panacisoli]
MATIELTGDNFASHVEDSDILLVDFWASWCGPCQQFAPTYEAASEAHTDITFGSINTEEQQELAAAAQVSSIPTLMAFRDGILVFSQPGALPPAALEELIGKVRELDMDDVRRQVAEAEESGGPRG